MKHPWDVSSHHPKPSSGIRSLGSVYTELRKRFNVMPFFASLIFNLPRNWGREKTVNKLYQGIQSFMAKLKPFLLVSFPIEINTALLVSSTFHSHSLNLWGTRSLCCVEVLILSKKDKETKLFFYFIFSMETILCACYITCSDANHCWQLMMR